VENHYLLETSEDEFDPLTPLSYKEKALIDKMCGTLS
jgi:hypothetical protein